MRLQTLLIHARRRTAGVLGAGLALLAASSARAQGTGAALTQPGTLTTAADQQLGLVIASALQRRAAFAAADKILAVLRRDDALAHPVGYTTGVRRVAGITQISGSDNRAAAGLPLHFGVTGTLGYYSNASDGRGGTRIEPNGGRVQFSVVANGIGRVSDVDQAVLPLDNGPVVLSGYRVTGELRGRPVYNGECTYLTNRSAAPLLPLTKERYLRLVILGMRADSARHATQNREAAGSSSTDAFSQWMRERPKREAEWRKTADELRKVDPSAADKFVSEMRKQEDAVIADSARMRGRSGPGGPGAQLQQLERAAADTVGARIRRLRSELDRLSPADRRQPVAVVQHGVDWDWQSDQLADANDADAQPLVEINPAFFDKSLAADVPQIIWICIPGLQGNVDSQYENRAGASRDEERARAEQRVHDAVLIRDHLDWSALAALLSR